MAKATPKMQIPNITLLFVVVEAKEARTRLVHGRNLGDTVAIASPVQHAALIQ